MRHGSTDPDALVADLREQVRLRDPARYPVQHATARFHLGTTLIAVGDLDGAVENLQYAADGFDPDGLPTERAKAVNMLGVALRERGDLAAADRAFAEAERYFEISGQRLELAASRFNRGLTRQGLGDLPQARDCLVAALDVFRDADVREQASAAARELGTVLYHLDELDDAVTALQEAADLARRGAGREALGTALNVLGIVHLRRGDHDAARTAFEDAAGAHPPAVRPDAYAMARANLALACTHADDARAHARLAARQALVMPSAASAVREQAQQILDDLGDDPAALSDALDRTPPDRWSPMIREEVRRLVVIDAARRREELDAFVQGQTAVDADPAARAEAMLSVLLEIPPEQMEDLIGGVVHAVNAREGEVGEGLRQAWSSAMVRFEVPQWMRLRDTFDRRSAEDGHATTWGH